jgi:NitT/TauT family transport system ATP-binding protein
MTSFISTAELTKTYENKAVEAVAALDSISLTVHQGELVAFLGPSGCGKSTLLNILAGLLEATSGKALVAGRPPQPSGNVGVMFQRPLLFPWRTVLKNVLLPAELLGIAPELALTRAQSLLALVGLSDWGSRDFRELSGGMQQRVALARVLMPDPEILLLDEPFGALDEITRESLDLELSRIVETTGKTVILVTHSIYEAVLVADRIYVFTSRPGRIAGVVDIPIPRPRHLAVTGMPIFGDKVIEVRAHLEMNH